VHNNGTSAALACLTYTDSPLTIPGLSAAEGGAVNTLRVTANFACQCNPHAYRYTVSLVVWQFISLYQTWNSLSIPTYARGH
jgi:hypothetical protein